jgi:hypothetical protein
MRDTGRCAAATPARPRHHEQRGQPQHRVLAGRTRPVGPLVEPTDLAPAALPISRASEYGEHRRVDRHKVCSSTIVTAPRSAMDKKESADIYKAFKSAVNMPPAKLARWLDSKESKAVGWKDDSGSGESVGHHSGRRIIEIKRKRKAELEASDFAHMQKVVGYVHRHLAQRPQGDVTRTPWRYSLMNWGHDPMQ